VAAISRNGSNAAAGPIALVGSEIVFKLILPYATLTMRAVGPFRACPVRLRGLCHNHPEGWTLYQSPVVDSCRVYSQPTGPLPPFRASWADGRRLGLGLVGRVRDKSAVNTPPTWLKPPPSF